MKVKERRKFYYFVLFSLGLLWFMAYLFVKDYSTIRVFK